MANIQAAPLLFMPDVVDEFVFAAIPVRVPVPLCAPAAPCGHGNTTISHSGSPGSLSLVSSGLSPAAKPLRKRRSGTRPPGARSRYGKALKEQTEAFKQQAEILKRAEMDLLAMGKGAKRLQRRVEVLEAEVEDKTLVIKRLKKRARTWKRIAIASELDLS